MKTVAAAFVLACVASLGAGPATKEAGLAGESHQVECVAREGELLRPRDASSKEGERIVIYPRQDWKCMTWRFEPAGEDGAVRLVNYFTHKTLYPEGNEEGAVVTQHKAGKEVGERERWRFVKVGEGEYRVEHVASGRVLTVREDGSVVVGTWGEKAGQKWRLLARPERFTA